jgi:SpoVK/Ycf46/Vps4 family AAA+-type ATPase
MAYISTEFKRHIFLHLYLNATAIAEDSTPLFFLIYGAPGEGKSFQLARCLREFDVDRHDLDSTAVEDPSAGRPDREIIRLFQDAAEGVNQTGRPSCLVMEDVHLLLGRYATTQYTMNLQHVLSQLILFADRMTNTRANYRIPVFMTANDTTVLNQSLVRHGRARQFSWAPPFKERIAILAGILPELKTDEIASLASRFPDKPVSFFAQLRHEVQYEFISDVILTDNPALRLRRAVADGPAGRPQIDLTLELLLRSAERLTKDEKGGVFLEVGN